MSLSFKDDTHLVCCLQRMITTLLNHHTRAVTTSRHHHPLGLIALIVIEPLNSTSIFNDCHNCPSILVNALFMNILCTRLTSMRKRV